MAILWCGGEDIDFTLPVTLITDDSTKYNSNLSRCCLKNNAKSIVFSSVTSIWCHTLLKNSTGNNAIGIADFASEYGIFAYKATGSNWAIKKKASSDTILVTGISSNTSTIIDLQIINYGVSATVNLYIAGVLDCTYTGDISIPNISSLNCASIISDGTGYFSQIITADEDTRLMVLKTIVPNAEGDMHYFSGEYGNLSDVELSDAEAIYSSDAGQEYQCNTTGMPSGTYSVKAIKMIYRATQIDPILNIQHGIKSGNTTHLEGAVSLNTYWSEKEVLYNTNPVTGVAFTPDQVNGLQFALKTVAA